MKQYRLSAALLCLLLVVSLLSTTALAYGRIDTGKETSLTISYKDDGVTFQLYQVATVSDTAHFTLTGKFADYPWLQTMVDTGDWDVLIPNLNAIVDRDNVQPLQKGATKNGVLTFSGLDTGLYLVLGQSYWRGTPEPFLVSLPDLDDADQWQYHVTVYPKTDEWPPNEQKTSITVKKTWLDDGHNDQRPQSITAALYMDGKLYDTVTLPHNNKWQYTWANLPTGHSWTVAELNVPKGYQDGYSRDGNTLYIVNTYEETPETPGTPDIPTNPTRPGGGSNVLPQTGLLWWPIPLLTIGGILLFLIGWIKCKKYGESHEKS